MDKRQPIAVRRYKEVKGVELDLNGSQLTLSHRKNGGYLTIALEPVEMMQLAVELIIAANTEEVDAMSPGLGISPEGSFLRKIKLNSDYGKMAQGD